MSHCIIDARLWAVSFYWNFVCIICLNWFFVKIKLLSTFLILNSNFLKRQITIVKYIFDQNWWIKWNYHSFLLEGSKGQQLKYETFRKMFSNLYRKSSIGTRRRSDGSSQISSRVNVFKDDAMPKTDQFFLFTKFKSINYYLMLS